MEIMHLRLQKTNQEEEEEENLCFPEEWIVSLLDLPMFSIDVRKGDGRGLVFKD